MKAFYEPGDTSPTAMSFTAADTLPTLIDGDTEGASTSYIMSTYAVGIRMEYPSTINSITIHGKMGTYEPTGWYDDWDTFQLYTSEDNSAWTLQETFEEPPLYAKDSYGRGYFVLTPASAITASWFKVRAPNGVAWTPGGGNVLFCEVVVDDGRPEAAESPKAYLDLYDTTPTSMSFEAEASTLIDDDIDLEATDLLDDDYSVGVDMQSSETLERVTLYAKASATSSVTAWATGQSTFKLYTSDDNSAWTLQETFSSSDIVAISNEALAYFDLELTSSVSCQWFKIHTDTAPSFNVGSGFHLTEVAFDVADKSIVYEGLQREFDYYPYTTQFRIGDESWKLTDGDTESEATLDALADFALGLRFNYSVILTGVTLYAKMSTGTVTSWHAGEFLIFSSSDGIRWEYVDSISEPSVTATDSEGRGYFTLHFNIAAGKIFKISCPEGVYWNDASGVVKFCEIEPIYNTSESGLYSFSHDFGLQSCGFASQPIEVKGGVQMFRWYVTDNFQLSNEITYGRYNAIKYTGDPDTTTAGEVTIFDATGNYIDRPCYFCIAEPHEWEGPITPGSAETELVLMIRGTGVSSASAYCFLWDLGGDKPLFQEVTYDDGNDTVEDDDWPVLYSAISGYITSHFDQSAGAVEDILEFNSPSSGAVSDISNFNLFPPSPFGNGAGQRTEVDPSDCTCPAFGAANWGIHGYRVERTAHTYPADPGNEYRSIGVWRGRHQKELFRQFRVSGVHTGSEWPYIISGLFRGSGSGTSTKAEYDAGAPCDWTTVEWYSGGWGNTLYHSILGQYIGSTVEFYLSGGVSYTTYNYIKSCPTRNINREHNAFTIISSGLYHKGVGGVFKVVATAALKMKEYVGISPVFPSDFNTQDAVDLQTKVWMGYTWDGYDYEDLNPMETERKSQRFQKLYEDTIYEQNQLFNYSGYGWGTALAYGTTGSSKLFYCVYTGYGGMNMPEIIALERK